jgi:Holliday junction DNA helicase RuvB
MEIVPLGVPPEWKDDPVHKYDYAAFQIEDILRMRLQARAATYADDDDYETGEEREFASLPPMLFENFVGQGRHVKRLKAAIIASEKIAARNHKQHPLPHMAFIGPAGTGKTSLAACCANALGRTALMTTGSALISMEIVADIVKQVNGGIMFIDEAHDLQIGEGVVSGMLPLLEDWKLSLSTGTKNVEPFTCIMATTEWGVLDGALRSRMGYPYKLDRYDEEEMRDIALEHAKRLDIPLGKNQAELIAKRSRKNPRECRVLLIETWHMALAGGEQEVTTNACLETFDGLRLDRWGLRDEDRQLLRLIREKPCAKGRAAGSLGMDVKEFEKTVVPFLFSEGYIIVGSRGVELTDKGKTFVGEI